MAVDVAVVVVTFNSEHVIDGLLHSIPPALGSLTADVVIVDNGSTDNTRSMLDRHECRLICSTNLGYAAGINLGMRAAESAPAVLILNPDVRLEPNSVPRLVSRLNGRVGVVVPKVLNPDGSLYCSLRRRPTLLRALGLNSTGVPLFSEYVSDVDSYDRVGTVDWALGAAMIVSADCLRDVGEWDESYFLYSEETDFCLRAADLDWTTLYEPSSAVTHIGGQSGQDDQTHAMQIVNRVRLYRRRHCAVASWAYFGLTVLSECTWIARGHRQSRFAVRALLRPPVRPSRLDCDDAVMPT